jgi:hypothetical protein
MGSHPLANGPTMYGFLLVLVTVQEAVRRSLRGVAPRAACPSGNGVLSSKQRAVFQTAWRAQTAPGPAALAGRGVSMRSPSILSNICSDGKDTGVTNSFKIFKICKLGWGYAGQWVRMNG